MEFKQLYFTPVAKLYNLGINSLFDIKFPNERIVILYLDAFTGKSMFADEHSLEPTCDGRSTL